MAESTEPQTPDEAATLHELAATHRRRHRWFALFWSVTASAHTTIILHTIWYGWPLDECDWRRLACFVVNALGSLGLCIWGLRGLRENEALERHWKVQDARWQAQSRAWHSQWEERRRHLREGEDR